MKHQDFSIGMEFRCDDGLWKVTDIGTRTVIAIRIDSVDVTKTPPTQHLTLNRTEAEADGWFNGPPYAVAEMVFDEYAIGGCSAGQERQQKPEAKEEATPDEGLFFPIPSKR